MSKVAFHYTALDCLPSIILEGITPKSSFTFINNSFLDRKIGHLNPLFAFYTTCDNIIKDDETFYSHFNNKYKSQVKISVDISDLGICINGQPTDNDYLWYACPITIKAYKFKKIEIISANFGVYVDSPYLLKLAHFRGGR